MSERRAFLLNDNGDRVHEMTAYVGRRCRKKPVIVKAYQVPLPFEVETDEGLMRGAAGDFLMKGVDGEVYPCRKDIFERTYDWVEEASDE